MEFSELINLSHSNSSKHGVDTSVLRSSRHMSSNDFDVYSKSNREFLEQAIPVLQRVMASGGSFCDSVLLISDKQGTILYVGGQENIVDIEIKKGDCLTEEFVGTTALSLCLQLKKSVQCCGEDNYLSVLKKWSGSASPVFDYNNRLLGVLVLFEPKETSHPHTLGLLEMMSSNISDKMWNNLIQKQLSDERHYAFDIVNNLSYSLFAITTSERIHWVNDTACRSLNIRRLSLVNKPIVELVPQWKSIKRRLDAGGKISDEEFAVAVDDVDDKYIVNAYLVKGLTDQVVGYVVTMRPYSRMVKMLSKFSLNSAYFTFKGILGNSEVIKNAIAIGKTAAKSPSTILITGESGTGKEVFAQSVHNASSRKDNNFVAINCGAISSTLIESELFGYEEGAFTGALKSGRPGKFELADNGTLFLDEIGEMSMEMQVKLLRAIQEKKIVRVGGNKEIVVDVRIIAATNKDLPAEMKKGAFRSDLYYRLNVIPISLPSIRQRQDDIPLLLQFFLKQKGQMLKKPIPEIRDSINQQLLAYDWPGNVRELENVAEKLVLFEGDIDVEVLANSSEVVVKSYGPLSDSTELKSLFQVEKETIENALKHVKGNISQAASILGVGRNTLYDKIKRHNIEISGVRK